MSGQAGFEIIAHRLYSRKELLEFFSRLGVDADELLGRIRPRKVSRMFVLGCDLLDALRTAPALRRRGETMTAQASRAESTGPGRRRGRKAGEAAEDAKARRAELWAAQRAGVGDER